MPLSTLSEIQQEWGSPHLHPCVIPWRCFSSKILKVHSVMGSSIPGGEFGIGILCQGSQGQSSLDPSLYLCTIPSEDLSLVGVLMDLGHRFPHHQNHPPSKL